MIAQADNPSIARGFATRVLPVAIVALAAMATHTRLAAAYPLATLLLFLWIASDAMMLALMARSAGRPDRAAILRVLAGASVAVWIGSPSVIHEELREQPMIASIMAILVLAHVAWATARARRQLQIPERAARDRWIAAGSELLPPALLRLAAAELIVIHMALFRWGGPADAPANARPFAYHKHLTPICATLLILSAIEMAVYHLLIGSWSRNGAVIMFFLSDVGFIYLVGLIKSFRFRPVLLTAEGVQVRAGFLIDQAIPLERIIDIKTRFSGEEIRDPNTLNASLLAWPNILLTLDRPLHRPSFLKRKRMVSSVAFRLDDPEPFIRLLRWRLGLKAL